FAFLLMAVMIVFVNAITKLNETIAELEERKTGIPPKNVRKNFSPLLPVGLLFNSCALILQDSVSTPVRHGIQFLAIALMLAGLYQTVKKRNE
ncbi:MAG: hypothetical protein K6G30_01735, partial [Acetatifactor sp.]|nr:hypothetical protein [Acetatifactor sp.]